LSDAVSDTSVIQYLYQIRLLQFLPELVQAVVIPPSVFREIDAGRKRGVDLPIVGEYPWIRIQEPDVSIYQPRANLVGRGEADVLRLALQLRGSIALLDDRQAREEARRLGIRVAGTLRLLIRFKQLGVVDAVSPAIRELIARGFRVNDSVVESVLREADE
jgi:predicted nucleic acid-binding protein